MTNYSDPVKHEGNSAHLENRGILILARVTLTVLAEFKGFHAYERHWLCRNPTYEKAAMADKKVQGVEEETKKTALSYAKAWGGNNPT